MTRDELFNQINAKYRRQSTSDISTNSSIKEEIHRYTTFLVHTYRDLNKPNTPLISIVVYTPIEDVSCVNVWEQLDSYAAPIAGLSKTTI